MSTVLKIVLGILIAAVLLIGGCVALIGVGLEGVDEEFDKQQAESAISNGAARAIENGTSKSDVIEELGVVPSHVVHPVLLGGWWFSKPQFQGVPDEVAR